ncbi:uncharacterized protein K452DRAFT_256809 [Aplosporella prunicola CBS 121167]|uniref:ATP-dependent RNA helicase n=1 Tax=Aplosporella prunicola CBS 121167 TaxID=1176127 RepID=A0A6A6B3S8_9PEZI|nr:uncharacterized protein K452DRAFT_256809 [Aplosporella prunicola CBS 121167]KAF2138023.1 hypothetical protein K452DRAFT_256809 [Aplosporella prunicola CBS 121167]
MLAPLRRCSASLPRALSCAAIARPALRSAPLSTPRFVVSQSKLAPILSVRSFQLSARLSEAAAAEAPAQEPLITQFADLEAKGLVHPNIIRSITAMGIETMTDVQSQSINEALRGSDMIAQAKTGTGKTIGFLLPMLQRIIAANPELAQAQRAPQSSHYSRRYQQHQRFSQTPPDIQAIVISPTRELAEQIAVEARKLTARTGVIVQTAVGGTKKREGLMKIKREGCHVLVATPGRLHDLLSDPYSGVKAPNLKYFVMDEADRLLDAGFFEELTNIQAQLPAREEVDRQTLMFSATVPKEVIRLVRQTLKPGFQFVRTVKEDEEPTHHRVPQKAVVAPLRNSHTVLLELIQKNLELNRQGEGRPFKAIVYINTLKDVKVYFDLFMKLRRELRPASVYGIHSQMEQGSRQRAADSFRADETAILFSSDVTARGMDFPNVTHVIQMGLPKQREDYIHRVGRTGRAGKEGEGWLIIPTFERRELRHKLKDLPIQADTSLATAQAGVETEGLAPEVAAYRETIKNAFQMVDPDNVTASFLSMIGGFSPAAGAKQDMIYEMNDLAIHTWGLPEPPFIGPSMAQKLGLNRLDGINTAGNRMRSATHREIDYDPNDPFGLKTPTAAPGSTGSAYGRGRSGGYGGDRRGGGGFGGDRRGGGGFGGDRRGGGGFGGDRRGGDRRGGGGFGGDRRGGGGFGGGFGGERRTGQGVGGDRRGGGSFGGDRFNRY